MSKNFLAPITKRIRQIFKYRNVDIDELMESFTRTQEMLQRRSVLEEIGLLTASIEHDIKNPLAVIESEIDQMKNRFQGYPAVIARVERIEEQKERIYAATKIIQLLRADEDFYTKSMSKTNINDLMHSCVKAVKQEMNHRNIVFRQDERTRDLFVFAYPPLLQQAIINILKNSIEAIHETKRGSGVIKTKLRKDHTHTELLRIEISDNGNGISDEAALKLTTLSTTKGDTRPNRGIGLFITDRIIQIHRGKLEIQSRVGEGTLVRVFLPKHALVID